MRVIVVAVLVAGAACNDPPGLTLEVIPDNPSVTEVQLFVGQDCHDCPSAMAPPSLLPRSTDLYLNNDKRVFTGVWRGDHAEFRLLSSLPDRDETFSALIAVGFDQQHVPLATATLHGVTAPLSTTEWWQVHLESATPIVDPQSDANGERIDVWPPAGRVGPQCVMVEHGSSGVDTIVPADDTDCDGVSVMNNECAPFTPNATRQPPLLGDTTCITTVPSSVTLDPGVIGSICLLGGKQCNEATPAMTASPCEPLDVDYCAPSALCTACANTTSLGDWDKCVKALLGTTSTVAVVGCAAPVQANGTECTDSSKRETQLDASQFLDKDNGNNVKCSDIEISEPMLPLSFHHSLPVGGATLTLKNFQEDCKTDVEWSGDYTATADNHVLVADLTLTNGKHLVVPFVVHVAFTCDNNMVCNAADPDANDTMKLCTRDAPSTTACTGTSLCFNGTPCGARCCSIGEACVEGVCQCGDGPHCVGDDMCRAGTVTNGCGTACCGPNACPPPTP